MTNISAIIQARMGSTRLPGKVLMKLNEDTVLSLLIKQLKYSEFLTEIIIATTTNPEDDVIEEFAKSNNIKLFRGSSNDVLDRYYQCAKIFSLNHIVRITADNPLLDPKILDNIIKFYKKENFDYVNNVTKRTFPYGTEVEIFSFSVLEHMWKNAKTLFDREHVTPYIHNNPDQFKSRCIENTIDYSYLHWTIDFIEDFKLVQALTIKIKNRPILLKNILELFVKEPELKKINQITSKN
jgi:spore coat polysaccharide biosynthesis protein SpsF